MDIEQIKTYEEELSLLGKNQNETARAYLKARRSCAKAKNYIWKEVAKDIIRYRTEKRNQGIDMAIMTKLAESQKNNDTKFIEMFEQYEESLAEYKALDRALQALQNQQTGVQSCVKWLMAGENNF